MVQKPVKGESWRDVVGYEGLYLVSNYGRIKSLPRKTTSGKVLKQMKQKSGHIFFGLSMNGNEKHHNIAKLMMQAFVGPCPADMECCHNDGNPGNNNISNLRYDTHKNNMADRKKHGTFVPPPINFGSNNGNSKLSSIDIKKIKELLIDNVKIRIVAALFKVHITTIYKIRNKKTWRHVCG
ncbi:hypothetical protein LCGC14_0221730 [marine sediment metagenome]|uniref:HNH nuclease domain-containing protein n=1 Tax=marine sediment metagenome TaxID=412755 RepID=A0A0F9UDQ6_9ZZZZ